MVWNDGSIYSFWVLTVVLHVHWMNQLTFYTSARLLENDDCLFLFINYYPRLYQWINLLKNDIIALLHECPPTNERSLSMISTSQSYSRFHDNPKITQTIWKGWKYWSHMAIKLILFLLWNSIYTEMNYGDLQSKKIFSFWGEISYSENQMINFSCSIIFSYQNLMEY
jgi:hypothetical protein